MPLGPRTSRSRTARPIFPPTATLLPGAARRWPISAVVVDLPLVPVTPIRVASVVARAKSSMSPMMDQPSARAWTMAGWGAGKPWGMPGLKTSVLAARQVRVSGSTTPRRSVAARWRGAAPSSHTRTPAPDAASARAAASPVRPSPSTATSSPHMNSRGSSPAAPQRSFRVERPARARIEAMIQKRITMVDSAHPFCSK